MTSVQPDQQSSSLTCSYDTDIAFQRTLATILTRTLTVDDKKLIANLIDQTKHIILHTEDLRELISVMKKIPVEQVAIETRELVVTECCKSRILPFKKIVRCPVLTEDDKRILQSAYAISVDTVYEEPFKSLN